MLLLSQGAEGRVFETEYLGRPAVVKERVSKAYRVAELDVRINRQRLLQEARCMVKCRRAGVLTPSIYLVDQQQHKLYMERVAGETLKHLLRGALSSSSLYVEQSVVWAKQVGVAIGKMHDADIVHGDLTTSNIMVLSEGRDAQTPTVVLIDFGLGMLQSGVEDKAVDLYVLERAFLSTHPGSESLVQAALEAYRFASRKGTPVLQRLDQVRQRGRKREMFG